MNNRKKILVTRPHHQAENICRLIEKQGWEAMRFPTIEIQARSLSAQEIERIQNINHYQQVFFVSANAVNFAFQLMNNKIECLHKISCFAMGKASYQALIRYGLSHAVVPQQGFNSEAMLALPETQNIHGQFCLIIKGDGGRELLADGLRKRGAKVDYLQVYKRVTPKVDSYLISEHLHHQALNAILIYSGDALQNLVQMLANEETNKNLLNTPVVVISQRVQSLAKKIGFKKIIIADETSDIAMMNVLLNGEECG